MQSHGGPAAGREASEMTRKDVLSQQPELAIGESIGPSWLANELLVTGESIACLALSGYYAVSLTGSDVGTFIT